MRLLIVVITCMLSVVDCKQPRHPIHPPATEGPESETGLPCGEYDLIFKHVATIDSEAAKKYGKKECKWRFKAPKEDLVIRIRCHIKFEDSDHCREEALIIFDGYSKSERGKRRLCGNHPEEKATSSTGLMIVTSKTRDKKYDRFEDSEFKCHVDTVLKFVHTVPTPASEEPVEELRKPLTIFGLLTKNY